MKKATKIAIWVVLWLLICFAMGEAEIRYASDVCEIAVRTGPGTDRKIIALVPAGRELELINQGDEWSEVRLSNGKEGFALNRELTTETPSSMKLERLEKKHTDLISQNKELQQKLAELGAENKSVSGDRNQTHDALQKAEAAYENLKKESAEFLKFKAEYQKNQKELQETREKSEQFENQLNKLASSQLIEGFLYGGGLVIIGFITGWVMKKPKRRTGLL
ncbi:MAG: TIGR04211 family SH3 domain-containing protein [Desulfobacteraceae bacterium]|nr:TIGR04211 family SH3 domain-containing protein [Desulfobacteraceae bacterium]